MARRRKRVHVYRDDGEARPHKTKAELIVPKPVNYAEAHHIKPLNVRVDEQPVDDLLDHAVQGGLPGLGKKRR